MRQGKSPNEAAQLAMARIAKYYPDFNGGLVAVNKVGEYGKSYRRFRSAEFEKPWLMMYAVMERHRHCTKH